MKKIIKLRDFGNLIGNTGEPKTPLAYFKATLGHYGNIKNKYLPKQLFQRLLIKLNCRVRNE